MISPELVRRYPIFAGLSESQIVKLANAGKETQYPAGEIIFEEGSKLRRFYVVVQGAIAINIAIPDEDAAKSVAGQITGEMPTADITVSAVGTGEVFAWSALVTPHLATASAKTLTACTLLAFDCDQLRREFEQDCRFGYLMMQKAAQVARDRLRDTRIESLVLAAEKQK